jgi:hypothetical protein
VRLSIFFLALRGMIADSPGVTTPVGEPGRVPRRSCRAFVVKAIVTWAAPAAVQR